MKNDVFSLAIGDCNLYTHSHRNTFAIKANDSLDNIKKAYLNSVAASGVSFTKHVDDPKYSFVGLEQSYGDYLDYTIKKEAAEKLDSFGINPFDQKYMYDAVDEYDVDDGDDVVYLFDGDENFVSLLMDFIKLSLPTLEYSILSMTPTGIKALTSFNDVDNGKRYDIGYMFEFENCYIFDR
jgi:hypothetical protein